MTAFRCPFEVKGEEAGLILSVNLTQDRAQNIVLVAEGFKAFHARPELVGLRCCLPASLRESCTFLEELKIGLLPFQADVLAGEMEWRFYPFLNHQVFTAPQEHLHEGFDSGYFPHTLGGALMYAIYEDVGKMPDKAVILAEWIEKRMREGMAQVKDMPITQIFERETGDSVPAFSFSPGGITCVIDRLYHLNDTKKSRNCFNIVRAPLYPRAFGRWSKEVEIVISREVDIDALSAETRKKIRTQANRVHKRHGVSISVVAQDKQPTGLWIPEYKTAAE